MSTLTTVRHTTRFKAGWIILLIAAVLMTLNHAMMIFVGDAPTLFIGYTAFTLYALLVIALPLLRGDAWAWYATWLLPVGLVVGTAVSGDPAILPIYFSVAAACVRGLLLTLRASMGGDRGERQQAL